MTGAFLRRALTGGMTEAGAERSLERMMQPGALGAALNWYRGDAARSSTAGRSGVSSDHARLEHRRPGVGPQGR